MRERREESRLFIIRPIKIDESVYFLLKKVNWNFKFINSFSNGEHEVQVRSLIRARVWHLQNTHSAERVKRTKLSMIKWDCGTISRT